MTQQQFPFVDPLVLEESDLGLQALFQSFLPTQSNALQQRQFGSLFQPTFNQFLGQLGSQIRQGEAPTATFSDFLQNQFNPQQSFLRQRGGPSFNARGSTLFRFNQ